MEDFKTLLFTSPYGIMSSSFYEPPHEPFGSLVLYDITQAGEIIIKTAAIAEHDKNLSKNPMATMLIMDTSPRSNYLTAKRATLFLQYSLVPSDRVAEIKEKYLSKFPNIIPPDIEPSFRYWQGVVSKVRWIGGFGEACWYSREEYSSLWK